LSIRRKKIKAVQRLERVDQARHKACGVVEQTLLSLTVTCHRVLVPFNIDVKFLSNHGNPFSLAFS